MPLDLDLARARADTPACEGVVHLNNAGAAIMPDCVVDATVGHLRLEQRLGGYEAAALVAPRLQQAYGLAAQLLHARAPEIAFFDSATRAFNAALWALPLTAGDRVLISRVAYGSNAMALLELQRRVGVVLQVLPSTSDGSVDLEVLERHLPGAALVALTHLPTNSGLVNPAAEVGRLCRAHGVPYLLDACQSLGQLDLDVHTLGCDMLSGTSRKYLRGPRGQGLLYVSDALLPRLRPHTPDLGSARWIAPAELEFVPGARRLECWEHSVAARLGLCAAMEYALGWGMTAIEQRVLSLAEQLRELLGQVSGVTVQDLGAQRSGIVTFTVQDRTAQAVQRRLAADGVNTSVSGAGSTLMDMQHRGLDAVVRASVHYYNTVEELQVLAQRLG